MKEAEFKKEIEELQDLLERNEKGAVNFGVFHGKLNMHMRNLCVMYYGQEPSVIRSKK